VVSPFPSFSALSAFLCSSVRGGGSVVSRLRSFLSAGSSLPVFCFSSGGRRVVFQRGTAFRCWLSAGALFVVVPFSFSLV